MCYLTMMLKNEIWHQEVELNFSSKDIGEENHSSPVVYRGGMFFLPNRCLSDTLTPVFLLDSFINGLIGE